MKTITLTHNQLPIDLALQYYGEVEGLELLLEDNLNITIDRLHLPVSAGTTIKVRAEALNKSVVDYFKSNNYTIATHSKIILPIEGLGTQFITQDGQNYFATQNGIPFIAQ